MGSDMNENHDRSLFWMKIYEMENAACSLVKNLRLIVCFSGKLVIADTTRPILLRAKHILIGNKGELHIGSPDCPYKGNLTISLFGR